MALLLPEDQAGLLLTPAMMEQLCAEHETVDTMLEELGSEGTRVGQNRRANTRSVRWLPSQTCREASRYSTVSVIYK